MDTTKEKSRTYEEIRDKYLYLIFRIHERYKLEEDDVADLTICYCECIQRNLNNENRNWSGRLQSTLVLKAKRILLQKEKEFETVSLEGLGDEFSDETVTEGLAEVEERVWHSSLRDAFDEVLLTLKPKEQEVLRLRFFDGKTLDECGEILRVTKERVRQVEAKALRTLRHPSRGKLLRPFLQSRFRLGPSRACKPREFFCYPTLPDELESLKQVAVPLVPERMTALTVKGPVDFEVQHAPESYDHYIIRVCFGDEIKYLRNGNLQLVGG